jgi:hypothetical protein
MIDRSAYLPPYLRIVRPLLYWFVISNTTTAGLRPKQFQASLPGDHRDMVPPDPIPNSEVKRVLADGSVEFLHVRVGHRQASKLNQPL